MSTGLGEVVLYRAADGGPALDVRLERESVWLNQRQMAELFDKDTDTVGLHIRNVFKEGELETGSTTEESSVVQTEGGRQVRRKVRFYNLDVIISVGYRVKSQRGTQFRIWATNVLRQHLDIHGADDNHACNALFSDLCRSGRCDVERDHADEGGQARIPSYPHGTARSDQPPRSGQHLRRALGVRKRGQDDRGGHSRQQTWSQAVEQ